MKARNLALCCFHFTVALGVAATMVANAHAYPTEEELIEYIEERALEGGELYDERKEEVTEHIEGYTQGYPGIFRFGNPFAYDYFEFEADTFKNGMTLACNTLDPLVPFLHSYDDLHSEPEYECEAEPGECVFRSLYDPPGIGIPSGKCEMLWPPIVFWIAILFTDASPMFWDNLGCALGQIALEADGDCALMQVEADLVEYLFPTHKVNISDQIFQSRYLHMTEEVLPAIGDLMGMILAAPFADVPETLLEVYLRGQMFISAAASDVLQGEPSFDVPLAQFMQPGYIEGIISTGVSNLNDMISLSTNFTSPAFWAWIQSQSGQRGFSRHWGEPTIVEDNEWFQPHEEREEPPLYLDVDEQKLSYFLPVSEEISDELEGDLYAAHFENPGVCFKNNIHDEKTEERFNLRHPLYPWSLNDPQDTPGQHPYNLDTWRCLDRVGEVNPWASHFRRKHNTDGFFQTFIKGMQVYSARIDEDDRYTYHPHLDSLHFPVDLAGWVLSALMPNPPLLLGENIKIDMGIPLVGQCTPLIEHEDTLPIFDLIGRQPVELVQDNWKWHRSNMVQVGSGNEGTVEVFTRFRGCWGFKGGANWLVPGLIPVAPSRFWAIPIWEFPALFGSLGWRTR